MYEALNPAFLFIRELKKKNYAKAAKKL